MKRVEIVTDAMRADCLAARDTIIELQDERDRLAADMDRLRIALSAALATLVIHGEDRLCALIRTTAGDCHEAALSVCGPILVVDNSCP